MKYFNVLLFFIFTVTLSSCAMQPNPGTSSYYSHADENYGARLPQHIDTGGEKVVMVDPRIHVWGAYDKEGQLLRAGIATAGAYVCDDEDESCHTGTGTFRIKSLGNEDCYSTIYPRPNGGGLMPYCMFFNGGQALHGAPDNALVEDNISHGCVRLRIPDAEWIRNSFASVGTKVVVEPY
jgi:lipoprotein-anchoring transpeptidase ErfK/SrfK